MMNSYAMSTDKHTGATTDNFDKKLKLFHERFEMSGITSEEKSWIFSLILSGPELEHFFKNVKGNVLTYGDMIQTRSCNFVDARYTLDALVRSTHCGCRYTYPTVICKPWPPQTGLRQHGWLTDPQTSWRIRKRHARIRSLISSV